MVRGMDLRWAAILIRWQDKDEKKVCRQYDSPAIMAVSGFLMLKI